MDPRAPFSLTPEVQTGMVTRLMAEPSTTVPDEDVARVREVLARELDTINQYEAHARAARTPELRDFFLHLAAEEKEHVAEAVMLLGKLDAGQAAHFAAEIAPGHFAQKAGPAPASSAKAPTVSADFEEKHIPLEPRKVIYGQAVTPTSVAPPLTVGSLRGSR